MSEKKIIQNSVPVETQLALNELKKRTGRKTTLVRVPLKLKAGAQGEIGETGPQGPTGATGAPGDGLSLYYFYSV